MNLGVMVPIIAIMATAWVIVSFIQYKQGRRRPCADQSATSVADARDNARLARENELLRLTIERLEERTAVLERIATDPATRTAHEIEALR
jgi:hypothetical protein